MDEYEKLDYLLAKYKKRLSHNISEDEWNERKEFFKNKNYPQKHKKKLLKLKSKNHKILIISVFT